MRRDAPEDDLHQCEDWLQNAQDRLRQAEQRRIMAEKDVAAGSMRSGLLEEQLEQLQKEQAAREAMYQDILREQEEKIANLQSQRRRRRQKQTDVIGEQMSMSELLGEEVEDDERKDSGTVS